MQIINAIVEPVLGMQQMLNKAKFQVAHLKCIDISKGGVKNVWAGSQRLSLGCKDKGIRECNADLYYLGRH